MSRLPEVSSARGLYTRIGKRMVDVLLGIIALIVFTPLLLAIGLLIRSQLGSPVLFRQKRPGLKGRSFVLLKFRTMKDSVDEEGRLLPDTRRLTSLGRFLRRMSLDELPEMVNVLKGEMSLVGPRPLLVQYLERYTQEQARRHDAKPGITGWAQVNGRNTLTWEQKFEFDTWYVDHQSLWLDLKILALTVLKIIKCEGISQPGHATAEEFMGTRNQSNS